MTQHTLSSAPPIQTPAGDAQRVAAVVERLVATGHVEPDAIQVVRAPLRICPLGAHIDHQLGVVTGMAIDRSILLAFAPTDDGSVTVESLNFPQSLHFSLAHVPAYTPGDWGNYVRGAALALQKRHAIRRGIRGVIASDMPVGGLSSSAAVTIAYLMALEAANGLTVTPDENVHLVTATEHEYIGLNNGILDQSVILFGQDGYLTCIDCASREIEQVPGTIDPAAYAILVVYSGMTKALVGTDYNDRVAECQAAARTLLAAEGLTPEPETRLRHVPAPLFRRHGQALPAPLYKRAAHYFGEMERVEAGVRAWQAGDLAAFGALINQSGASSVERYECGSPQLITLYYILRETPGVYGARFSGAGFRGSCIALIDPRARDAIAATLHARYPTEHPDDASRYSIHFCRPAQRAGVLAPEQWSRL